MEFLIAVDLEGIHGIVGEPYKTLTESFDYKDACEGAILEINAVADELFKGGATRVCVWDNHGGGGNLDPAKIDPRCEMICDEEDKFRFDFVERYSFRNIIFLGYHAAEGVPKAVLAHTYSSKNIQYLQLGGDEVGEITVDTLIADSHGIRPLLIASDEAGVDEMRLCYPEIYSVVTKFGKSRNEAELRPREEVLAELRKMTSLALKHGSGERKHDYHVPCRVHIRYTRAERASEIFEKVTREHLASVGTTADTHVLQFNVFSAKVIPSLL